MAKFLKDVKKQIALIVEKLLHVLGVNVNSVDSTGRISRHITEEASYAKNMTPFKILTCCEDNQTAIARLRSVLLRDSD